MCHLWGAAPSRPPISATFSGIESDRSVPTSALEHEKTTPGTDLMPLSFQNIIFNLLYFFFFLVFLELRVCCDQYDCCYCTKAENSPLFHLNHSFPSVHYTIRSKINQYNLSITCRWKKSVVFIPCQLHSCTDDFKGFLFKYKIGLHADSCKVGLGDAAAAEGYLAWRDFFVVYLKKFLFECHFHCPFRIQWTSSSSGFTWTMQCLMFGFCCSRRWWTSSAVLWASKRVMVPSMSTIGGYKPSSMFNSSR